MMPTIGDSAPDFSLPDQTGQIHTLSHYRGSYIVLYFYPKDQTPGCTKEACGFRDAYAEFSNSLIRIFGISKDSVSSHASFAAKQHLPFPILSNETHSIIEAYGAWIPKKFMGKSYMGIQRMTVCINPEGKISKIYTTVDVTHHATDILHELNELQRDKR